MVHSVLEECIPVKREGKLNREKLFLLSQHLFAILLFLQSHIYHRDNISLCQMTNVKDRISMLLMIKTCVKALTRDILLI